MPNQPKLTARIFTPLKSLLAGILPDFAKDTLAGPAVRAEIVQRIDLALLLHYPASRMMPEALRRKVIARFVDIVLDRAGAANRSPMLEVALSLEDLELTAEEMGSLETTAPGNSVRGFLMDAEVADHSKVDAAVRQVLGNGWTVERLDDDFDTYRARHSDAVFSVPDAWTRCHELEETHAIARAEPEILWVPAPLEIGGPQPDIRATSRGIPGVKKHLPCSDNNLRWHLDIIHADLAWKHNANKGKAQKGKGVTIGHLDTGVTHHAELRLDSGNIHLSRGWNFYDPDHSEVGSKPLDPMDSDKSDSANVRFMTFDGHGTGTLSVITGGKRLTGVAPEADVIPYRVAPTVVHFDLSRMAEAMRAAHKAGCDVITMSMGGPKPQTNYLHQIIARAAEDGVIICTAAGNVIGSNNLTPMVVWPAAFDEVIACAGCNCQWQPWSGSSRGNAVNITAAAQDVWNANGIKGSFSPGGNTPDGISRGDGTSFATPTVAGMAACWLAHHGGRKALANHYGHPRYVPLAFAHLLATTAHFTPDGWRTDLMGPGILDSSKLMRAALPSKSSLTGWRKKTNPFYTDAISNVAGWIGGGHRSPATRTAEAPELALGEVTGELGYHLFDRPALLTLIRAHEPSRSRSANFESQEAADDVGTLLGAAASDQLKRLLRQPPSPHADADANTALEVMEMPQMPEADEAEWTILVYMAGDNDLDDFGQADLLEMKKGLGACESINIIVQRDTETAGVSSARYWISGKPDLNEDIIQNLGETNTGDPAVLQDFLEWGLSTFPAKRTMAVLWNHGSGWDDTDVYRTAVRRGFLPGARLRRNGEPTAMPTGFVRRRAVGRRKHGSLFLTAWNFENVGAQRRAIAFDDEAQDFLDNVEMKKVFDHVVAKTGRKFDIIGMDACLMSMLEIGCQLKDCGEFFCGSQEIEPAAGWQYEALIGALASNPQMPADEFARMIVNEFIRSYPAQEIVTQSAWRFDKIGELAAAVNDLGRALTEAKQNNLHDIYRVLTISRRQVQSYDNRDYVDLGHLSELLVQEAPGLAPFTNRVTTALNECILANSAPNAKVSKSTGISIYYPKDTPSELYKTLEFGNGDWAEFITYP